MIDTGHGPIGRRGARPVLPGALSLVLAAIAIAIAVPGPARAQLRGCDAADARCMDEAFAAPCLGRDPPWPASCEAVLAELTSHPDLEREPVILLMVGFAHSSLVDAATAEADATSHRQAARASFRQAIALEPALPDAYLGLANLTDDPSQRIDWLRLSARSGERSSLRYRFLATALEERGSRADLLEAAAVMREAYDSQSWGLHKWYLGSVTLQKYNRLGLAAEASEFRRIVGSDIGFVGLQQAVGKALSDPDAAIDTLQILCYPDVVSMFGANECVTGLGTLWTAAAAAADTDLALAFRLAVAGHRRMLALPRSPSGTVQRTDEIIGWLERMTASGLESPEILIDLGRCYLESGQDGKAVDALERARPLSASAERIDIDRYMRLARDSGRAPTEQRPRCLPQNAIYVD